MNNCESCGVCCKLFLINLDEYEYKSGNYITMFEGFGIEDDFSIASDSGQSVIAQKEDGSCVYLSDGKCSIHLNRPKVCREFFCDSDNDEFEDMIKEINKNKL